MSIRRVVEGKIAQALSLYEASLPDLAKATLDSAYQDIERFEMASRPFRIFNPSDTTAYSRRINRVNNVADVLTSKVDKVHADIAQIELIRGAMPL